jgi:hypothetical protein
VEEDYKEALHRLEKDEARELRDAEDKKQQESARVEAEYREQIKKLRKEDLSSYQDHQDATLYKFHDDYVIAKKKADQQAAELDKIAALQRVDEEVRQYREAQNRIEERDYKDWQRDQDRAVAEWEKDQEKARKQQQAEEAARAEDERWAPRHFKP